MNGFLYVIGIIFSWPVWLLFFKNRYYYENKKSQSRKIKKGAIIISNHKSILDFMAIAFMFPFRKLYCLMSELIYNKGKVLSFLVNIMGGIKVDRSSYDFSFIGKSIELLDKNKVLTIYPESKLPKNNRMQEFKPSYIIIALKSGKPIIPIYTDGQYGLFKRTRIVVGDKIYLSDYCKSENPTKEEIDNLNKLVRNKILELEKLCKLEKDRDKYIRNFGFGRFQHDLGKYIVCLFNIKYRIKYFNAKKEQLRPKGSKIVIANHVTFSDALVLINALKKRRPYSLVGEVVFDGHPVRGYLLGKLGCIRIDRNNPDLASLKKCIDIVKCGGLLILFPSGRLNKDNEIEEFKTGISLIALQSNADITPIYINYNKKRFNHYHLFFGEDIKVSKCKFNGTTTNEKTKELTTLLYDTVKGLEKDAKDYYESKQK